MLSGIVFSLIFYAFLALLEGMISKISFLVCPNKWVLFCHLIFSPPPNLAPSLLEAENISLWDVSFLKKQNQIWHLIYARIDE